MSGHVEVISSDTRTSTETDNCALKSHSRRTGTLGAVRHFSPFAYQIIKGGLTAS